MSLLSQQVALLSRSIYRPSSNPAAEVAKQQAEAKKSAILVIIEKHGPIGETEISERSGLTRTCVHNHLMDMERSRSIKRASDKPRAPWVSSNPIKARLVTFETKEDLE